MKKRNSALPGPIALLIPSMAGGGAEKIFLWLANSLVRSGFEADLILFRREGPLLGGLDSRVRVVDLGVPLGLLGVFPLALYLRRERPQVLLSALEGPNLVANLAKILGFVRTRVITSHHNMEDMTLAEYGSLKGLVYRFLYAPMIRRADALVAVSKGVKDQCLVKAFRVPEGKISVIYNPIILEPAFKEKTSMREDWYDEDWGPYILNVGRLELQKDQAMLLRAFERVRKIRPVKLLILGEGHERSNLERMVEQAGLKAHVKMPGFVPDPSRFMAKAALFVLSSRSEGFSLALLEAMFRGVPIVSTDCLSGPAELLEDGKWGRLVPVGDEEALAQAMLEALEDAVAPDYSEHIRQFESGLVFEKYLELMGLGTEGKNIEGRVQGSPRT
jgi:glycosyltransferase involved in cell wall biosynthesis